MKGSYKKIDGTFRDNKSTPIHRWYPYVEGFSESFVKECLKDLPKSSKIYDPFNGSGTTSTTCTYNGFKCYASEINPFLRFIAETKINTVKNILINNKLNKLSLQKEEYLNYIKNNKNSKNNINNCYKKFDFFSSNNLKQINNIKHYISTIDDNDIRNIFLLALSSIIVKVSKMTRSTDLRKKTEKELKNVPHDVYKELDISLSNIILDIVDNTENTNSGKDINEFYFMSFNAKTIDDKYKNSIDCIITSPPYINGTNYFRNTKLELWILDYIYSDNDAKKYRAESITAGINNVTKDIKIQKNRESVLKVVKEIEKVSPDKRIPKMVEAYFSDMSKVFENLSKILKKDGKIYFDIGDSQYYNIYVPVYDFINEISLENKLILENDIKLRERTSKNGMKLTQRLLTFRKD